MIPAVKKYRNNHTNKNNTYVATTAAELAENTVPALNRTIALYTRLTVYFTPRES